MQELPVNLDEDGRPIGEFFKGESYIISYTYCLRYDRYIVYYYQGSAASRYAS